MPPLLFMLDTRVHVRFNRKLSGHFRGQMGSVVLPRVASPWLDSKGKKMILDLLPEPGWFCQQDR